jgi:hypothetical protein
VDFPTNTFAMELLTQRVGSSNPHSGWIWTSMDHCFKRLECILSYGMIKILDMIGILNHINHLSTLRCVWVKMATQQLWTLRASGINKLRRLGRSTKSLWVSNRALFIVFRLFVVLFIVFYCFLFAFLVCSFFVCFFICFFVCFLFCFDIIYFQFSNEWRSLDVIRFAGKNMDC